MALDTPSYLTPAEAARILGVTPARVKQLDAELQPTRSESGRRFYPRDAVERLAAQREAAR